MTKKLVLKAAESNAIGLWAPEAEYEVLLQFACGVIVTLEAQDGHVTQGREMLHKTVPETALGLTDVEEATLGATDAVNQVDGCAGEPVSNVDGLFCALNVGEGGGVGA
eukprot:g36017.t1